MEGDIFPGIGNGTQVDGKVLQTFQKNFTQVQNILDQNRVLIREIKHNHDSKMPDNLSRNVGLIRELNNNIRRVVDLYADLSSSFARSMEASSEGELGGKHSQKRVRSGLLANEINQNHESKMSDNLSRNVGLTRELNNIRKVVDLYADLSSSFGRSLEASSEGKLGGNSQKRVRSGVKLCLVHRTFGTYSESIFERQDPERSRTNGYKS
ncbi:protein ELF4-LIKE 4 isoform X1 [Malania oleifera]|uniref:protein ELF4-LIKE 4 isoform X1 n=1 Tax=Malania oleifera TaxID=397392 RepID=UPI0025AE2C93|nr:protein ELF4-LIKE 4 isoform X1 [Malania oleifera]